MAGVTSKVSGFLASLGQGAGQDWDAVKATDVELPTGGGGLPPGIEGGIAQLTKCYFKQYEKGDYEGQWYFYSSGVIVTPYEHTYKHLATGKMATEVLRGRTTKQMEAMCDTPGKKRETKRDHFNWLKNLWGGIFEIDVGSIEVANLEDIAKFLEDKQPFFRFRTWGLPREEPVNKTGRWFLGRMGPYANEMALKAANPYWDRDPMVNEVWMGPAEDPSITDGFNRDMPEVMGVMEAAAKVPAVPNRMSPSKPQPAAPVKQTLPMAAANPRAPVKPVVKTPLPKPSQVDSNADGALDFSNDLDLLARVAADGDDLGQITADARLRQLAEDAGVEGEWMDLDSTNYDDIVIEVRKRQEATAEDVSAAGQIEEEWKPKVADVWYYTPLDAKGKPQVNAKTKKPVKIEVEVLTVNEANKTVTLKDLATNKLMTNGKLKLNASWTDLSGEE
jgi:hypothetical protein